MTYNMKNSLVVVGLALMSVPAMAQKAKVVTAYNYNKNFETRGGDCAELVKGIEAIEEASKDSKTMSEAKTWYYGGNLYYNAYFAPEKKCRTVVPNALEKAYDYYLNALKYNIEDGNELNMDPLNNPSDYNKLVSMVQNKNTEYDDRTYTVEILVNKMPYIANAFANRGVNSFNSKQYEPALKDYATAIEASRIFGVVDTASIYNSALTAERLENYEDAAKNYSKLIDLNYGGGNIYLYLSNVYLLQGDTVKRIQTIQKGRQAYPDNLDLITQELQYYLESGKSQEALANFEIAIAKDPENAALWYNRGYIYDQSGDLEKAAADYKKAIELEPENFDAAYNLGAMYYNKGVELNEKANSYPINETKKYDKAKAEADEYFLKAKPHLEKALEITPDDPNTLSSLLKIYAIAGETEKYKEMKARLDATQK